MDSKKVQLYLDREKAIEASPVTGANCVILSDGNDLQKVLNNDLTTPTVVHEESSFKTGVGDIDVSSSVVDGEVGRMVIKGKTYQNILPEPSTHVLTNNKEMFKVNEGLDPNVEIVDGVSKSAILSGQTLVNVSGEPIVNLVINSSSPKYLGQHILKKDTMYTFIYDIEEVTGDASGCWGRFNYTDGSFKNVLDKVYTTGTTKVVTSFDKDLNNIYIGWIRNHVVGQSVKFKSVMILEGDWTDKEIPPYFDGMQSVNFYPDQTVTKLVWKAGQYYGDNGQLTTVSANQNHRYIDEYVKISPNMTYRVSGNNNYKNLNFYDENKNHLLKVTSTSQLGNGALTGDIVATAPNNAKYLRYNMAVGDNLTESTIIYNDTIGIPLASTSISETYTHKMPVLCTTGKNLFDSSTEIVTGQGINSSNGLPYNYPTHSRTGFLRVKPNTSYTITQSHNKTWVFAYDKNKEYIKVVKTDITSGGNFTTPNDTHYIRLDFNTVDTSEIVNGVQIEEGSIATPYEPYKSNILTVNEEVELRGIGDVQDTLDLMTGELTQKFAMWRVTAEGSHWRKNVDFTPANGYSGFNFKISSEFTNEFLPKLGGLRISCTPFGNWAGNGSANEGTDFHANGNGKFVIESSKVPVGDLEALRAWLRDNPVYICYELATPTIKTVDLSTSGNWEKIVLDGKSSENWQQNSHSGNFVQFEGYSNFCLYSMNLPVSNRGLLCDKLSYYGYDSKFRHTKVEGISDGGGYRLIFVRVKTEKLPTNDVAGFKQWLSQNPIEVSYMLSSHQDSTQVKQPIFFKDGHIQLSSGADNSLIPTLDYQAKTSNSYVMDLMKTNTRYTMKAKSASGTFTIDGTSYGAGTNGTFTTPTSMTNKLLVMSNNANEEVMIIEGDVTDKTIPYFKGIKSAFEDEDKIEVLSQGKNLLDPSKFCGDERWLTLNNDQTISISQTASGAWYRLYKDLKIPTNTYITLEVLEGTYEGGNVGLFRNGEKLKELWWGDEGKKVHTYNQVYDELKIWSIRGNCKVRISITETEADYEPYKSNSTKIPLLSPLRSLPNGVCDELIIDRMKKKATLIQRVGKVVLNGSENWTQSQIRDKHYVVMLSRCSEVGIPEKYPSTLLCSHFINQQPYAYDREGINVHVNYNFHIGFLKNRLSEVSVGSCKKWLSQNPTTVYYELSTPVVTEIDLENFPLVYKDGHIFLNSEIAPMVEINYNVNQSQQIQANNETLQRHELDILDLDNLIVSFVNAEYNLRLLKFNMELSMMALAE